MLTLRQALRLSGTPVVAIVGAGGKTTTLFRLAEESIPSMVSTTTHLGEWQVSTADRHVVCAPSESMPNLKRSDGARVTLVTGELNAEERRYRGLTEEQIGLLRKSAGHLGTALFIESDGSRGRPLKAPADYEPAIPADVEIVLVIAGLQGLGKPLTDEHVHRPQIFAQLSGLEIGGTVTTDDLYRVLIHRDGGLRNIPEGARRVVLLNQADTTELRAESKTIAPSLLHSYDAVVVASLEQAAVHAVHEKTAGIVLAAGASVRFGKPKQLLDYQGKPFVRTVAETALAAGLSPVRVVTGAHAEKVEAAVEGLSVTCVRNSNWSEGQSTSIHAGLAHLPHPIGAAVFLLTDQPQVQPEVIRALVDRHAEGLHPVVAPWVEERRANPVLFDRRTFEDLASLSGDIGGRAILPKYEVEYLVWPDRDLLLDVDTPEDYERLKN